MSSQRNRGIILASGAGLGQRAAQLFTTLITLPLVLHTLGVAGFGVWGAATSLAWLAGLLDLGMGSALVTLLPSRVSAGEPDVAREYVAAAFFAGCGLSAVIILGCGILSLPGSALAISRPFLLAMIGLALNVPLSIARNVWFGLQKGYISGIWELVQTVFTLGLLVLAGTCHAGVVAMVAAVYGALLFANAGSLLHLFASHPEIQPRRLRISLISMRTVLGQGGLLFAIAVTVSCSYFFDNLLTLHWLGAAASAQITIALRLCTTAAGMISMITFPLWPAFAEATARHDRSWALRALVLGTAVVTGLVVFGAAVIVPYGIRVLRLWLDADIGIQPALLWATAAWIVALCVPSVTGILFNALSILRFQFAVAALALGLSFILKFALEQKYGVPGILASTAFSWLLIVWPAFTWRVWRWINAPSPIMIPLQSGI